MLKQTIKDPKLTFSTLYDLIEWHFDNNQLAEATEYANQAELLLPKLTMMPQTYKLFHLLSKIHHAKKQFDESAKYHNRYYETSEVFIDEQEKILMEYKKFQMDLIITGFEAEQLANEQASKAGRFQMIVIIGAIAFMLLITSWHFWFRRWRRGLWNKVFNTMLQVDRPPSEHRGANLNGFTDKLH
ncbi:MAG: hypothetical protein ABJG47_01155 [Ekhidna sp.]